MVKLEILKQMFFDLNKKEKLAFEEWIKNEVNKILIHGHNEDDGLWETKYNE